MISRFATTFSSSAIFHVTSRGTGQRAVMKSREIDEERETRARRGPRRKRAAAQGEKGGGEKHCGAERTTTGGFCRGSRQVFCNRFVWCGFAVRASAHLRPNRRLPRKLWHSAAKTRKRQRKCDERGAGRLGEDRKGDRDSKETERWEGEGRDGVIRERLSRRDCCVETFVNSRCLPNQAVSSLNVDEPTCLLTSWGISLGLALIKRTGDRRLCLSTTFSRHERILWFLWGRYVNLRLKRHYLDDTQVTREIDLDNSGI